jgi:putative transposase
MAEGHRMTAADLVDKLLASEHADGLGDRVAWLVAELMEAEVGGLTGAGLGERARSPPGPAQRLPGSPLGHPGWRARAGDPEAAPGQLLPVVPGAAPAPPSRPWSPSSSRRTSTAAPPARSTGWSSSWACKGCARTRGRGGAVAWMSRSRGSVSGRCRAPIPICGWTPRWSGSVSRAGAPQGASDRRRRAPDRPARGGRSGRRGGRDRGVLARLPAVAAGPRAGWMQLVISDAHTGLHTAIATVFGGRWQRGTVQFLRDMLGHVHRAQPPLVSGVIRQIFTAASAAEARQRLGQVADQLRPQGRQGRPLARGCPG